MSIRFGRSGKRAGSFFFSFLQTLVVLCLLCFNCLGNGYDSSEVMETEDDDWRKVTDLNERRKIQNRLAQRNYREYPHYH